MLPSHLWLDEPLHPERTAEDFACHTAWTQASQNVTVIKPRIKLEALRERYFRSECSQQPKDTHSAIQVYFSQKRIKLQVLTSLRLSYLKHPPDKMSASLSQPDPSAPWTDSCTG